MSGAFKNGKEPRLDSPLGIVGVMVLQDALDAAQGFIESKDMCDREVAHVRGIQSFRG